MKNQPVLRTFLFATTLVLCVVIGWMCTANEPTPVSPGITPQKVVRQPTTPSSVLTGHPDLAIDSARLARSIKFSTKVFKSTDCAVAEGCITTPGKRNLVRFDVATPNFGTADLILGNPADHPDWFVYSPCHQHYHLKGFSEYRLRNGNGIVVTGHKQAFCLEDLSRYWTGYPSHGYTCANQGISVGWGDVYGAYLDCQWLDITGVPSGNYFIEVVINKSGMIDEGLNVFPDSIDVPVTIK